MIINHLGGGFKNVLFSALLGEDGSNLTHIFQMGWFNHQPATHFVFVVKISKSIIPSLEEPPTSFEHTKKSRQ